MNKTLVNNNLVIITGPTSVGKSHLAVELAKKINGEIISADSMQVYKGMDIGTAKVNSSQMQGIPHYLIDIITPNENYNAALFSEKATECIKDIQNRGKTPIIAGGTGFYIQAILYGVDFSKGDEDSGYREYLENRISNGEIESVYSELKTLDPVSAESISINDHKRIIRALEFFKTSGTLISEHNEVQNNRISPYNFAYFVLNDEREKLYTKIDLRVDEMISEGLLEEVKSLYNNTLFEGSTAAQAIGYKQLLCYLRSEIDLEEAIRLIKRDTRHYAKRQITWFKREKEVIWINKNEYDYDESKILSHISDILRMKKII